MALFLLTKATRTAVICSGGMRRSTLWFALAAAWAVLLALNLRHHHDLNTLVMAVAVTVFAALGVFFRRREAKQQPRQPKFK